MLGTNRGAQLDEHRDGREAEDADRLRATLGKGAKRPLDLPIDSGPSSGPHAGDVFRISNLDALCRGAYIFGGEGRAVTPGQRGQPKGTSAWRAAPSAPARE